MIDQLLIPSGADLFHYSGRANIMNEEKNPMFQRGRQARANSFCSNKLSLGLLTGNTRCPQVLLSGLELLAPSILHQIELCANWH